MDVFGIEQSMLDLLKGQFSSLSLTYNDHSVNYQTAIQADNSGTFDHVDWVSENEEELAIRNNTVWILQWYPNTPVGFCCIGASTLQACLAHAAK